MGTFLQEGPNSQMKEEEFYDAVDAGLDRLDEKFDEMMVWMLTDLFIYSIFCRINAQRTLLILYISSGLVMSYYVSFQTEKASAVSHHSKISLNPQHPLYNEVLSSVNHQFF